MFKSNVKFINGCWIGRQIKLDIPKKYESKMAHSILNEIVPETLSSYGWYKLWIYAYPEKDNIKTAIIDEYDIREQDEDICKVIVNCAFKALLMNEDFEEVHIQYSYITPQGTMCVLAEKLKNGRFGFEYF